MPPRPSFKDLNAAERQEFGNGVGAFWFPEELRHVITKTASWFFKDASWRYHDFGYAVGGDRWDRARCDWKFFKAMLKDGLSQRYMAPLAIPTAIVIALLFYIAVRAFGGCGSFQYRDRYLTLAEIKASLRD